MIHLFQMNAITQEIEARLQKIEQEEQVCIFYACESGSRAWGFPSADSDYDVRFLYLHPQDWYLSIQDQRDVIERKISDSIDLSGWDIRKALNLLRKSNPPLLEWLSSPIVYQQRLDVFEIFKAYAHEFYSPKTCLYHYFHKAQTNYKEYLRGEPGRMKKYFYTLRPILACLWIEAGYGVVPMEFHKLVDRLVKEDNLRLSIEELIQRKSKSHEYDQDSGMPVVTDFIEIELKRFENLDYNENLQTPDIGILDKFFRKTLKVAWQ
jgi:uncharacterized protein